MTTQEQFQQFAADGHTLVPVVREVLSDLDTPLSVYLKLAALDRFEQVGVRAVGELQVHRQRRVEVRGDLAHERTQPLARRGEQGVGISGWRRGRSGVLRGGRGHAGLPWTTGRRGRQWRQATIANRRRQGRTAGGSRDAWAAL